MVMRAIGGGSYWAGRAVARPPFCPCGPRPPTFERHLNITYNITAVLHSHYNVLTSTDIENGIVCCGSVYTTGVDGFTASVNGPRHGSAKIFF